MDAVLRVLGWSTIHAALGRLEPRQARWLSATVLVAVNLWPLAQVLTGAWQPGDVLVFFWIENLVVWLVTVVKILTARGRPVASAPTAGALAGRADGASGLAGCGRPVLAVFFTFHYGIFTLVHGVFTWVLASSIGVTTSRSTYVSALLLLAISHGVSLALYWFVRGERDLVAPATAMMQPYLRVVILHVVVLASFFLIMSTLVRGGANGGAVPTQPFGWLGTAADTLDLRLWPAVLLVGIKIVVDLVTHLRQHRSTR